MLYLEWLTILFITFSPVTCVVSFSLGGPWGVQKLALGGVLGIDSKDGIRELFWLCLWVWMCWAFLASEKCDAANSWHAVATWLIKLSPVVICDECWPKLVPWGPSGCCTWLMAVRMATGTVVVMATEGILRASESLRKESDKLGP